MVCHQTIGGTSKFSIDGGNIFDSMCSEKKGVFPDGGKFGGCHGGEFCHGGIENIENLKTFATECAPPNLVFN